MYGLNSPSLDVYFEKCVSDASTKIDAVFGDSLEAVRTQLNLQYRIGAPCFGLFGTAIYPPTATTRLMFSSFHKNLIAFLAATDLSRKGLYGPARVLLRQILEWLVIAKFCSVSRDEDLADKWMTGTPIWLSPMVFSKIDKPHRSSIREFWTELCRFAHATIYSQQPTLEVAKEVLPEIATNLGFIHALLECNYHLLSSHVIPGWLIQYVKARLSAEPEGTWDIVGLRKAARNALRRVRPKIDPQTLEVIRDYRSSWQVKTHSPLVS